METRTLDSIRRFRSMQHVFDRSGEGCGSRPLRSVLAVAIASLAVLCLLLQGCSRDDSGETAPTGPNYRPAHREIVHAFDAEFEATLRREARRRARSAAIVDGLQPAANASGSTDSGDDAAPSLTHRALLESIYARHDYAGRWFESTPTGYELSESGRELFRRLDRAVRSHGLWPDELHLYELRRLHREHDAEAGRPPLDGRVTLTDDERTALLRQLAERDAPLERSEAFPIVADLAAEPEGPTPRVAEIVADAASEVQREAERVTRMDLLLSDALVEYAIDMRYGNPAWHEPRAWRKTLRIGEHGPLRSVHLSGEEKEKPTAAERMQKAVRTARTKTLAAEMLRRVWARESPIGSTMEHLQPPYRQYDRLVEAFERYRGIVDRGGWPEVPSSLQAFDAGMRHPDVRALKRRLHLEGYWSRPGPPDEATADEAAGDGTERAASNANAEGSDREDDPGDEEDDDKKPSPVFTPELKESLQAYQETHQLWGKGQVTAATLRSLNVSAERRWHQIRVTLERWRHSRIGADRHYVHVNIPGFHAEVWKGGTREMRFRVVVGSQEQPKDEDEKKKKKKEKKQTNKEDEEDEPKYPRATPRFSGTMQYVVLNPYWNVPHGIWQNELKPKKKKNPKYYEKHGYEVVEDDNGHRFLRQKPGKNNALGKVKFLFPNEYSVYMHDTNEPYLFEKPFRAFSHGCIRIQKPMKFLHYLLDLDGRWTGDRRKKLLKKWFSQKTERWLRLRETLPVHIEYHVVRVDGQGRAHFGADLYDLDDPRLGRIEARLDSLPDDYDLPRPSHEQRLRAALDGRLHEQQGFFP